MTWSIDLPGARGVCAATDSRAAELDTLATDAATAFDEAQAAVPLAPETYAALADVAADPFLIRLAGMRRMVSTVTQTTSSVIDLYEAGDLEMAADTQSTMSGLEP